MRTRLKNVILLFIFLFSWLLGVPYLFAGEKCSLDFNTPGTNSVYTRQQSIEVGDIPGHEIRIFELKRIYPDSPPRISDVSIKEVWRHGFSDYTNATGSAWGYDKFIMENGDIIFLEWQGTSVASGKEGLHSHFVGVLTITGGTGNFAGIKGILVEELNFSSELGYNESGIQGQYWFE